MNFKAQQETREAIRRNAARQFEQHLLQPRRRQLEAKHKDKKASVAESPTKS